MSGSWQANRLRSQMVDEVLWISQKTGEELVDGVFLRWPKSLHQRSGTDDLGDHATLLPEPIAAVGGGRNDIGEAYEHRRWTLDTIGVYRTSLFE